MGSSLPSAIGMRTMITGVRNELAAGLAGPLPKGEARMRQFVTEHNQAAPAGACRAQPPKAALSAELCVR